MLKNCHFNALRQNGFNFFVELFVLILSQETHFVWSKIHFSKLMEFKQRSTWNFITFIVSRETHQKTINSYVSRET